MRNLIEELISLYYLTAEVGYLKKAVEAVTKEIETPSLQKTVLVLDKLQTAEVSQRMSAQNFLKIPLSECTNCALTSDGLFQPSAEAEVEIGKLIRVYPAEVLATIAQMECLLFQVASFDSTGVLLVMPPAETAQAL